MGSHSKRDAMFVEIHKELKCSKLRKSLYVPQTCLEKVGHPSPTKVTIFDQHGVRFSSRSGLAKSDRLARNSRCRHGRQAVGPLPPAPPWPEGLHFHPRCSPAVLGMGSGLELHPHWRLAETPRINLQQAACAWRQRDPSFPIRDASPLGFGGDACALGPRGIVVAGGAGPLQIGVE